MIGVIWVVVLSLSFAVIALAWFVHRQAWEIEGLKSEVGEIKDNKIPRDDIYIELYHPWDMSGYSSLFYRSIPRAKISPTQAIMAILDHLDMELDYISPVKTDGKAKITKKDKGENK